MTITCSSCRACCCKLEVILMGDDDPPGDFIENDRWGGQVMRRLDDGWCAALDRKTMLCRIYERRPGVCRDYEVGASDCLTEREALKGEKIRAEVYPYGYSGLSTITQGPSAE